MKLKKLRLKRDFDNVYRKGRSLTATTMYLKIVENGSDETRLKVVVSKKISNKAVVRNKNRRRIEEALRLIYDHIAPGFDGVVFLLKDTNKIDYAELNKELMGLLKKSGLLK